jgi:lipopolysaccharide/colanic/teichoic acid biosynthesis glycosyltransferase
MQPKRIAARKSLQRAESNYKPTGQNLGTAPLAFHEPAPDFSRSSFTATDFRAEDFPAADLGTMEFALPDVIDPRIFRILGPRLHNGHMSARGRSVYEVSKRAFDMSVALTLLVVVSPLLVVIALFVKATSKGPIFFAHQRLGENGRLFACLKFRTMIADAEERLKNDYELRRQFAEKYKLEHDPRITSIGNFLRRTSLDELPQLLHVLTGEMSLVGPRPIVQSELSKYSIYAKKLLSVKPGLSGLWQVCGRSHTTYPERVMMDMHYVDHRSFMLDLQLLFLTASAVVRKSGAW